jgi:hypothetical protein
MSGNLVAPNTRMQRTRSSASPPHSPLTRCPLGGPNHYLISRSPGQHVGQAGRGEQSAEVSREDRLPTR